MFIERFGTGPVVVLVHGLPSPPEAMRPLARALAADHRVLLVHLPGYGHSAPPALPYDFRAVNAALARAVAREGGGDPAFVGYSAGCLRGLLAVLEGQLRVRAFVGLSPLAHLAPRERAAFRALGLAVAAGADPTEAMASRLLPPDWAQAHPAQAASVRAWARCVPGEVLAAECLAVAELPDLRERLPALGAPTYLRVGALDEATPPARALEMARHLPDATVDVVPGVGHASIVQDPDRTAAAVRAFLRP